MDLWHGQCRSAAIVPAETGRGAVFVLEANYQRWKKILKGELNVVKELATRKLRLVPFNFKKAVKLAAAAQAAIRLVDLAGSVGVVFPDELDGEKQEGYRIFLKRLRTDFGI
jgi:putative sterol carrier protein